jgi:hypothetical protein
MIRSSNAINLLLAAGVLAYFASYSGCWDDDSYATTRPTGSSSSHWFGHSYGSSYHSSGGSSFSSGTSRGGFGGTGHSSS